MNPFREANHRIARDDEFVEFVTAERARLVAMARLLTGNDHDWAEDVVQTTLTRLYIKWSTVRRADNRIGYARRVLTRIFIDDTRRAHRRRESTSASPVQVEPVSRDPDSDLRAAVLTALANLPPGQRAVVVMRHWLDHDVATTARLLRISAGTVKSQNARALEHLREVLGPVLFETVPPTKESS